MGQTHHSEPVMPKKRVGKDVAKLVAENPGKNLPGQLAAARKRTTALGEAKPPKRGKRGPEGWKLDAKTRNQIENLKVLGCSDLAIARYVGVHIDTLKKHAQHILDNAVMTVGMEAIGNLRELGKGETRANQYVLNNRFSDKWRESRSVTIETPETKPDFSRASPEQLAVLREAAMVMKALREPPKVIDHEPSGIASDDGGDDDADAQGE